MPPNGSQIPAIQPLVPTLCIKQTMIRPVQGGKIGWARKGQCSSRAFEKKKCFNQCVYRSVSYTCTNLNFPLSLFSPLLVFNSSFDFFLPNVEAVILDSQEGEVALCFWLMDEAGATSVPRIWSLVELVFNSPVLSLWLKYVAITMNTFTVMQ